MMTAHFSRCLLAIFVYGGRKLRVNKQTETPRDSPILEWPYPNSFPHFNFLSWSNAFNSHLIRHKQGAYRVFHPGGSSPPLQSSAGSNLTRRVTPSLSGQRCSCFSSWGFKSLLAVISWDQSYAMHNPIPSRSTVPATRVLSRFSSWGFKSLFAVISWDQYYAMHGLSWRQHYRRRHENHRKAKTQKHRY